MWRKWQDCPSDPSCREVCHYGTAIQHQQVELVQQGHRASIKFTTSSLEGSATEPSLCVLACLSRWCFCRDFREMGT